VVVEMRDAFLAVDWGTTNRRVFRVGPEDAELLLHDSLGVTNVPAGGFEAEARRLREAFGDLPMICAGMVGSDRGWRRVPYAAIPITLGDLARRVVWIEPSRTAITPGASLSAGRHDVMRGEELQFLGAAAAGLVPKQATLCQPGTHCKWAEVRDGVLTDFATAMTGELFALLKAHSLLSSAMRAEARRGAAFDRGLDDSAEEGLLTRLFGARAATLLGSLSGDDGSSYVSGLLIGSDVRAQQRRATTSRVWLIAESGLGDLYEAALDRLGIETRRVSSQDAFVAGARRLWEHLA
jgi:2-dehydro-3-deoxygalactonokinase